MYANEKDSSNEQEVSVSDDEIRFLDIKEESPKKMTLVSQVENKFYWIIDSDCLHHRTSDMNII